MVLHAARAVLVGDVCWRGPAPAVWRPGQAAGGGWVAGLGGHRPVQGEDWRRGRRTRLVAGSVEGARLLGALTQGSVQTMLRSCCWCACMLLGTHCCPAACPPRRLPARPQSKKKNGALKGKQMSNALKGALMQAAEQPGPSSADGSAGTSRGGSAAASRSATEGREGMEAAGAGEEGLPSSAAVQQGLQVGAWGGCGARSVLLACVAAARCQAACSSCPACWACLLVSTARGAAWLHKQKQCCVLTSMCAAPCSLVRSAGRCGTARCTSAACG